MVLSFDDFRYFSKPSASEDCYWLGLLSLRSIVSILSDFPNLLLLFDLWLMLISFSSYLNLDASCSCLNSEVISGNFWSSSLWRSMLIECLGVFLLLSRFGFYFTSYLFTLVYFLVFPCLLPLLFIETKLFSEPCSEILWIELNYPSAPSPITTLTFPLDFLISVGDNSSLSFSFFSVFLQSFCPDDVSFSLSPLDLL